MPASGSNELRAQQRDAESRRAVLKALADNYERMGKLPACREALQELADLEPSNHMTWFRLGNILAGLGRHEEAVAAFARVLGLWSAPEAHFNSANSLMALGRTADALSAFQAALKMRPGWGECWTNMANAQLELGQHQAARASLERAFGIQGDSAQIRRNLANLLLFEGLSERALALYESRLEVEPYSKMPTYGLAPLGRQSPDGKRILVQWEQAFGDVIQMLRFVPRLEARAEHCVWQLLKPLHELVARAYPGIALVEPGPLPGKVFDARLPYTSLPLALGQFDDAMVPTAPYLRPDPAKVKAWKDRAAGRPPLIGLAWRGREHPRFRSVPLAELVPLFGTGASFLALQKDITEEERRFLSQFANVIDGSEHIADFDDTAAAIAGTTVVISIDTAVAHLAGALGQPCWVIVKKASDWRWKASGPKPVWYPSLHLFRQQRFLDWSDVIEKLRLALTARRSA
ncbi:MAG: tetratricopeptide repeat protein [Pseudomonadota bacterium]